MRSSSRSLLALALGLAASPVQAAGPTSAALKPVISATMGQAVPVEVNLQGVPDGEPTVTLYYRNRSANAWGNARLVSLGKGRYAGDIPTTATHGLAVRYWVKVLGPSDSYQLSFGSPDDPLSVDLFEPQKDFSDGPYLWGFIGGSLTMLMGLMLWWNERRHRNRVLDRAFWVKTLGPLYGIPGPRLAQELRRLCGTPLDHPVKGLTIFPRATIMKKLYEIGYWDEKQLKGDIEKYAGDVKITVRRPGARLEEDLARAEDASLR